MSNPITQNAINYVRSKATSVLSSECVIERVTRPTYDDTTGTATTGSRTTIYEGPCRVWEVTSGAPILVAEDEVIMQSTQLSIPWDTDPLPNHNDEVEITASRTDTQMVGKRFVIDSSAKAGEMRATRRFAVRVMQR